MHLTYFALKIVAMRAVMFRSVLILLLIFFIKRPSFVTSDSVFYSFQGKELNYNAATFIYESLYLLQNVKTPNLNPSLLFYCCQVVTLRFVMDPRQERFQN